MVLLLILIDFGVEKKAKNGNWNQDDGDTDFNIFFSMFKNVFKLQLIIVFFWQKQI
jgi:hypothetical protein